MSLVHRLRPRTAALLLLLLQSACVAPEPEPPAGPVVEAPNAAVAAADPTDDDAAPADPMPISLEVPVRPPKPGWTGGEAHYAPPPQGRIFRAQRGGFTIVEANEQDVVTVNFRNFTARWIAGLHAAPADVEVDRGTLAAIWPLRAGKQATYHARRGVDRWEVRMRVLGERPFEIGGGQVLTMLVESRVRALTPTQGGLDLTRRIWYAPDYRWIVRLEDIQHAGPKVALQRWRIVEVTDTR